MFPHTEYDADPFAGKDEAIKNLGGMVWLYEKHLSKFMDSYADSPVNIRKLLAENRLQEACIMIHSIKGLSGTLGLNRIHKASCVLEMSIRDRCLHIESALLNYELCIAELVAASQKY